MAPEVLNQRGRGAAADIWSFGIALFKMMTGRMPFRDETIGHLLADIEAKAYKRVMAEEMASRAYSDDNDVDAAAADADAATAGGDGDHTATSKTRRCARAATATPNVARMSMKVLELFDQIFNPDPTARPTAADLLDSNWFGNVGTTDSYTTRTNTSAGADNDTSTGTTTNHTQPRPSSPTTDELQKILSSRKPRG